jgi:hypothetical protein
MTARTGATVGGRRAAELNLQLLVEYRVNALLEIRKRKALTRNNGWVNDAGGVIQRVRATATTRSQTE